MPAERMSILQLRAARAWYLQQTADAFLVTSVMYLIYDRDSIFWCTPFKRWCARKAIRPRYGAIARHRSIAVVERLITNDENQNPPQTRKPPSASKPSRTVKSRRKSRIPLVARRSIEMKGEEMIKSVAKLALGGGLMFGALIGGCE